ncbi:hypothetical protein JOB18_042242, partial [Solea senegalensis]
LGLRERGDAREAASDRRERREQREPRDAQAEEPSTLLSLPNQTRAGAAGTGLLPLRLCLLHAPPSPRATRLSVRPPGPRTRGGRPQEGEAGPQGGPLVPTHRGGVLLIGHTTP